MLKARVGNVKKYVKLAFKQKKPLFLHGAPGIGKSSIIRQAARELQEELGVDDFFVKDIRLSQLDPTDLGGIPVPKDGAMDRYYPKWWPTGDEYGIIFFDELNKGTPSTQAAAYQLILDGSMGDRKLSPNVMIVAAGNRSSDNVTVYDMDSALQNRFPMHIEVEPPTKEELVDYFESIGKVNMHVYGFLDFSERSIWRYDEKSSDPAWASPRSWEFLIDLLELVEKQPKEERVKVMKNLAVGAVGDVVGREFFGYVKFSEEVDIKEILRKPSKFRDIKKPDVRHSVITEIADRYKRDMKSMEAVCIDFIFEMREMPEYLMLAIVMFNKASKGKFVTKVASDKRGSQLAEYMEDFI